jgi:hypothetical protein
MKYQPITYDLLKENKACKDQLALFEQYIGLHEPIPLNDETIEKFSPVFDIDWAVQKLFDVADLLEYDKIIETHWKEYWKILNPLAAKRNKALSDHNPVDLAAADIEYNKAKEAAWPILYKACATEFVRLYKQGLTSE